MDNWKMVRKEKEKKKKNKTGWKLNVSQHVKGLKELERLMIVIWRECDYCSVYVKGYYLKGNLIYI